MTRKPDHCTHDGFHSGQTLYRHEAAQLRYVIVCDTCLAELREVGAVGYRPRFRRMGHPPAAAL